MRFPSWDKFKEKLRKFDDDNENINQFKDDHDPNNFDSLFNKGASLGNLGRYDEAIEWYDKALKVDVLE